ncbi:MAG TPA: 23S rRNA (guanosine(2251)-2'-O)-methyltransferase RlmB [Bacilli bacterium]|jgi:23S rRNA (guanosine2251-2'-O)-methyltransferase|nr:23S rRNA (guanosine(2251)-2'-O)-methyltransferase RlmB [Bacilli bacterium]HOH61506.1 23S rRNA (guanosine(2251)-2'-O)-methyltransferase RlmB [Bacilli bacterium]HPB49427.1 23S rRNA (guanosine(2251)-2'-O)-methyltransferase RlmB [Bacilli bacterium]HPM14404.1 23S rRNA (guanosine(2251)-2'-O)-methyltransferase RlmB [Bacilli bacterium]HPY54451.1 23S rRNA (guanosine(2251)-2'-O)-methyltransferase RlmB [Bacilli bacterium]
MSEYIFGKNVVKEAFNNPSRIEEIYVLDKNMEFVSLAKKYHIKYTVITSSEMNKMVSGNHQGVVALVKDYHYYSLSDIVKEDKNSLIVALDGLEDPHNLGAILRTCEAAGIDGVILPKKRSVKLNSTVAKVSTGAIEYVKVVEVVNLTQTLKQLKNKGYWIIGAERSSKSSNIWELKYDMPIVLVIGSEGKGISRLVKEECDFLVEIPMQGKINSLNASVSTGIMIYEIRRQQK